MDLNVTSVIKKIYKTRYISYFFIFFARYYNKDKNDCKLKKVKVLFFQFGTFFNGIGGIERVGKAIDLK